MCNFPRTTGTYLLQHYLPHVTGQLGGALPAPCDGSVVWRIICPTRWVSVEWHVTSPKHRVWLFQALAVSSVALLGPGYYQFWGVFVKCQTNLAHFLILLQSGQKRQTYGQFTNGRLRDSSKYHVGHMRSIGASFAPKSYEIRPEMAEIWPIYW